MASAIDPIQRPKSAGDGDPPAAKPAAKPNAPAAAATPPVAARAPAPAQAAAPSKDSDDEEAKPSSLAGLLRQTPAWAVSALAHVVALLAMALIISQPPAEEKPRVIVSSGPESEEPLDDLPEDAPDTPVENPSTDSEMVDAPEVAIDVPVTDASDVDAAPVANVELTTFGDVSASSELLASLGGPGGKGVGIGARRRSGGSPGGGGPGGGGSDADQAVEKALKWLAEHQCPDGGWDFELKNCPSCGGKCNGSGIYRDRAAPTALALLPFLGRGITHLDGPEKYKAKVKAGIQYLVARATAQNGKIDEDAPAGRSLSDLQGLYLANSYVQAIGTIALCECYAMTQDPALRGPTQLALKRIIDMRRPDGSGWDYVPDSKQQRPTGDLSIFGFQMQAIKAGKLAGFDDLADKSMFKYAEKFLDSVQASPSPALPLPGSAYWYVPGGENGQITVRDPMIAVGLLSRMFTGWKREEPALQAGVAYLAAKGPTNDLYYDYYATQVMFHTEGNAWKAWNDKMKPMLIKSQSTKGHEAGSWYEGFENHGGAKDKVDEHVERGGRLYLTSLAALTLEVYYRYEPIYSGSGKGFKEVQPAGK